MPVTLPSALQPRLQSHREGVRQGEGCLARQSRADGRGLMEYRRPDRHAVRAARMRQLLQIVRIRSEEHTSELQSLMRISYGVFCLNKTKKQRILSTHAK